MTRRHSGPAAQHNGVDDATTTTTDTGVDPSSHHLLSMLSQTPHSRAVENDYIENPCASSRSTSEPPRDKQPVLVVQEEVLLGSSMSSDNMNTTNDIIMYGDVPHTSQQRSHRSQHRNHHRSHNNRHHHHHHHTKITKADLTSERHRRPMPLPGAAARVSSFSLPNNFTTRSTSDRHHVSGSSIFTATSTNMYLPGGSGAPVIPPRPFSSSTSAVNAAPFRQRTMTDDHLHSRPPPPLPSDSRGSIPPRPSSTPPPRPPKSAEVVARLGMAPLRDSHSETIMVRHHSDWLRIAQPLGVPVGMVPPMRTDVFRLPIRSTPPVTAGSTDSPTHQIVRTTQPLRRLGDNPQTTTTSKSKKKSSSSKTSDSSSRKSSKKSSKSSRRSGSPTCQRRIFNSKLTASDSTQPLMKHGLRVDVTVPESDTEETDKLICKKDAANTTAPHHCPHCGKCVCPKCVQAAPTATAAAANNDCHCNSSAACVDACVETVTCVRCVRGCFYHCSKDDEDEEAAVPSRVSSWADKPCACRGAGCCLRWSVLGFMSCLLPCLFCYPVLKGCTSACHAARKGLKSSRCCHDDDS